MYVLSILMIYFASSHMLEKPTLIYIGDPMCSWCYGVSAEMSKVKEHFSETHDFELIMGGLRPFNTETMVDLKDFLSQHWEEVHQQSGLPFTYDILDNPEITYDTEPPCRAVVVVREINPDKTFEFFKAVQQSFYYENKNMHLTESYRSALKRVNISYDDFAKKFESPEAKQQVQNDFTSSSALGVQSFPTLLLKNGNKVTIIANGYASADQLIKRVTMEMEKK